MSVAAESPFRPQQPPSAPQASQTAALSRSFADASREFLEKYPQYRNKMLLEKVVDALGAQQTYRQAAASASAEALQKRTNELAAENAALKQQVESLRIQEQQSVRLMQDQANQSTQLLTAQLQTLSAQLGDKSAALEAAEARAAMLSEHTQRQKDEFQREEQILTQKLEAAAGKLEEAQRERAKLTYGLSELAMELESMNSDNAQLKADQLEHQGQKAAFEREIEALKQQISSLTQRNTLLERKSADLEKQLVDSQLQLLKASPNPEEARFSVLDARKDNFQPLIASQAESPAANSARSSQYASPLLTKAEAALKTSLHETIREQQEDLGEFAQINNYLKAELEACTRAVSYKDGEIAALRRRIAQMEDDASATQEENLQLRQVIQEVAHE